MKWWPLPNESYDWSTKTLSVEIDVRDEWDRWNNNPVKIKKLTADWPWYCWADCDYTTMQSPIDNEWLIIPIRCKRCVQQKARDQLSKKWTNRLYNLEGPKYLVTFTQKSPIHDMPKHVFELKDIVESEMNVFKEKFRKKVRRSEYFKRTYLGGCYTVEATAKEKDGKLSVHAHIHMAAVVNPKMLDFKKSDKWEEKFGIRTNHKKIYNQKGAIGYITSYLTKDRILTSRQRETFGIMRQKLSSE